jgi:pyruvate dehydrogenase E2 component (dihydrolipoamide acetyltransferase)
MGGGIALAMALDHADRVASVTAVAPAGLGQEINMDYIDGFIAEKRAKKLRPVLEMLVAHPEMISKDMVEDVLKFKRLDGVDQALAKLRDGCFGGGNQQVSLRERLGEIKVPIQVIVGKRDQIIPVTHTAGLPAAIKVTTFDDAGHMPHMEKAADVNDLIRALAN